MYRIPDSTRSIWEKKFTELTVDGHPLVKTMTESDFNEIEVTYGYPLPSAYKEFVLSFGCAVFYDQVPYRFGYTYERDGMKEQWSGVISSFKNKEALLLNHIHLIADPDNETESPFFPPNMLPFAGDLGQDELLLELGSDQARVWYWKDQPEAWGEGDNQILGFVADNLYDFINNLSE